MFHSQSNRAERQSQRGAITGEIIEYVQKIIQEELESVPAEWSPKITDGIMTAIVGHTEWVLGSLTLRELESEVARVIHLENVRAETRHLINLQMSQENRS
jgi:hypothetical protein